MSVAPASAGLEQIVPRPFSTATALAVLAGGATAGTGPAVPVAHAAPATFPNPLGSSADGTGITPVPLPLRHDQQFAWVATDGCHRLRARHSGKCVNVVGASTADLALLGQRTCGTASGFQWSRVRHPASTPARHP
ncbi:RICIN domain-containing protein [Streptomyces jeddahensis]|uniref:Ricin B lectin domain-containing protein n=1 Tax=Streptomyces jeddahensis TaxID=1716141 RepID=A0A177HGX3_9ACTN|nr:RICIN domain-containing protein [Streptomyces jeddahensis]OAH09850.1 hypothetical protein STSP_68490 [Streptomyces jeddahensis]